MAEAFAQGVDDLGTFPDKAKIDALCMIAEDASGSPEYVQHLAEVVLEKLAAAPPNRRIPILYVIDAVGKNRVVGPEFQTAVSPRSIDVISAAFQQAGHEERVRMQRTVNSWFVQNVFPAARDVLAQRMAAVLGPFSAVSSGGGGAPNAGFGAAGGPGAAKRPKMNDALSGVATGGLATLSQPALGMGLAQPGLLGGPLGLGLGGLNAIGASNINQLTPEAIQLQLQLIQQQMLLNAASAASVMQGGNMGLLAPSFAQQLGGGGMVGGGANPTLLNSMLLQPALGGLGGIGSGSAADGASTLPGAVGSSTVGSAQQSSTSAMGTTDAARPSGASLQKLLGVLKTGAAGAGAIKLPAVLGSSGAATAAAASAPAAAGDGNAVPSSQSTDITTALLQARDNDAISALTTALDAHRALPLSNKEQQQQQRDSMKGSKCSGALLSRAYYLTEFDWVSHQSVAAAATSSAAAGSMNGDAGAAGLHAHSSVATSGVSGLKATTSSDVFDLLEQARARGGGGADFSGAGGEDDARSHSDSSDSDAEYSVPAPLDGSSPTCALCGDTFTKALNDEDEWVLRGAVLIDGEYYHHSCYATGGRGVGDEPGSPTLEEEGT